MRLDNDISSALETLQQGRSVKPFNAEEYIRAFEQSAQSKAQSVLDLLKDQPRVSALRPVFLSVGGGDGAELEYLLTHSTATAGVLIESERTLANIARQRATALSAAGLRMEVFEGDAKHKISDAVSNATALVASGAGDYFCVTCHAVLHELFDRGDTRFDIAKFFGTIFSDYTISTWFTYREPGVPDKWPEEVLLKADCEPQSLLLLAQEICRRHSSMRDLEPSAHVLGDHVRLNRTLAMEVLAKLFYLPDILHEIEERSTAVDHSQLTNILWYAIGDRAREASRANITTISQPTGSFIACWERYGVTVLGLTEDGGSHRLPVAESQTRVIAWRLAGNESRASQLTDQPSPDPQIEESILMELALAKQAVRNREDDLLSALLAAKGRSWVESRNATEALAMLADICNSYSKDSAVYLWSHYLLKLFKLFSGGAVEPEDFSLELATNASQFGLGPLFKAERMEFCRKCSELDEAITIANSIRSHMNPSRLTDTTRYVHGTAAFLLGNMLRHGGLYHRAWEHVAFAQSLFRADSAAQATELAHCYYAKAVCVAMTGKSQFDAPFEGERHTDGARFATALITLSYSHAAWFVGDVMRARQSALQAADQFADLRYTKYAARAKDLASLLGWWQSLESGQRLNFQVENGNVAEIVRALIGQASDFSKLSAQFSSLRPSVAIGLLQFWRRFGQKDESHEVLLPPIMREEAGSGFSWIARESVPIGQADQILREACSIPPALRVPLIAD